MVLEDSWKGLATWVLRLPTVDERKRVLQPWPAAHCVHTLKSSPHTSAFARIMLNTAWIGWAWLPAPPPFSCSFPRDAIPTKASPLVY